ncbi:fumarylacetoacetate hydrolase family protein [Haloplanus pelagicus]|jgi:2-dehydro-3-deoxy-D-arabinonate dehydratase|uniref:fumarylacetoacetate hydrolase family protein n=1 Tax=Haloplanus pelagicus TaxID=2949995 RepID=UPI00203F049C|nr:fumarylacetoacetate hydrolase family protein [Haloplanus sp. HW8-1]
MRYYRYTGAGGTSHLAVRDGDTAYDLTSVAPELETYRDLLRTASAAELSADTLAERHVDEADSVSLDRLATDRGQPVVPPEVWAAGVTYRISEEARESESSMPDLYLDVYDAERPELFFKATPSRTVGPDEPVGVRGDSAWNVPEPELGLVLYRGDVVGYTIGNDMSSRTIEGENPLYLPQAKVYDRCCSLGPCVASADSVPDPTDLDMRMVIRRNGSVVFDDETTTAEMVRRPDELVSYLYRHNTVPDLCVLLTGTSLVPEDEFTLKTGDEIRIEIDRIGTLRNDVVDV